MARTLKGGGNGPGHNSGGAEADVPFIRRIIILEAQRRELAEDIKAIYAEAKEVDIRVKPIRRAVKLYFDTEAVRLARAQVEAEAERIIHALGGYADTPLGQAAVERAEAAMT